MIGNKRDLQIAYGLLLLLRQSVGIVDDRGAAEREIVRLKREIRRFLRPQKHRTTHRIIRGDSDGYLEIVTLPDRIDSLEGASEYFENHERREYIPSQYDCTGQLFTSWYKPFKRRGRYYCYHRVLADV